MPVVEVKKPEHYCEMGHMVCEIFKKLGKTCKAGMKTQQCPQKKGKKADKKAKGPSVKKFIGIDMPFNYEEVTAMTGPEYVASLQTGEVAFMPYEQLKAKMSEVLPKRSGQDYVSVSVKSDDFPEGEGKIQPEEIEIQESPAEEAKTPEHYCETGEMVCEIFKKLGKTCKAGMKTQQCPQKKGKKAAKKSKGPDVRKLIGVDMPFDYEQVAEMTGAEYASHVDRNGYAVPPYEELKARMQNQLAKKQEKSKSAVIDFPGAAAAGNVLVIDDEAHIAKNIKKILSKKGYEVDQAITKEQALEQIKARSYNLVLLDLKIPGVKGLEMLKAVKESQPEARVIIITGYASIESAKESARLGIVDYVHKPFTPDEIRNAAQTALVKAA
jgi:CheY-like chemotaxis protein